MSGRKTVLILTRDEDFSGTATKCLIAHGCAAKVLKENYEALLSVLEEEIDVIVLDADGEKLKTVTTTVKIIEKCRPKIPIVVATSDHSIASGAEILREGIFYYLMKPLVATEFGEVIERALLKREYLEKGR